MEIKRKEALVVENVIPAASSVSKFDQPYARRSPKTRAVRRALKT